MGRAGLDWLQQLFALHKYTREYVPKQYYEDNSHVTLADIFGINSSVIRKSFYAYCGLVEFVNRFQTFSELNYSISILEGSINSVSVTLKSYIYYHNFKRWYVIHCPKALFVRCFIPASLYVIYLYTVKWRNHTEFKIVIYGNYSWLYFDLAHFQAVTLG